MVDEETRGGEGVREGGWEGKAGEGREERRGVNECMDERVWVTRTGEGGKREKKERKEEDTDRLGRGGPEEREKREDKVE